MILQGHFFSQSLEMKTEFSLVIPNSRLQDPPSRPLRTCYLLHGLGGRNNDWIETSQLVIFAEKYDIAFIMPDVGRSFYRDMKFGQRFFTYVSQELPAVAARVFNISSRREDTMILGASMGGYGALNIALSRPEQYAFCGAFAPACLFLKEGLEYQRNHGLTREFVEKFGKQVFHDFQTIFGPELAWNPEDDILELLRNRPHGGLTPSIFMACGTEDQMMIHDNRRFIQRVSDFNPAPDLTYREWPGGHDWFFFNQALTTALEHFAQAR